MVYKIELPFKVGDKVNVLNYRKKPAQWEPGTIMIAKANLNSDGSSNITFDVLLDRRTNPGRNNFNGTIWLHVSQKSLSHQ